jgi:ketopantoate reductase
MQCVLIARGATYEALTTQGLICNRDRGGSFSYPPSEFKCVRTAEELCAQLGPHTVDVVILCVKTFDVDEVAPQLRGLLSEYVSRFLPDANETLFFIETVLW